MSKEKTCLLCNTENAKYDAEFLEQRTYFSAPKLRELRVKWNEAIAKIHPILKTYVNNLNTYHVCDLHFRESDIKKNFEANGTTIKLPTSKWCLRIESLPLSSEELGRQKPQNPNKNVSMEKINTSTEKSEEDKLQNENKADKHERSQTEQFRNIGEENLEENTPMKEVQEHQSENNNENEKIEKTEKEQETQKGQEIGNEQKTEKEQEVGKEQETEKSLPSEGTQSEKDNVPEKEKSAPLKLFHRPIRPDLRKKVETKYSPYPILKSFQQGVRTKAPQIVQLKSGKNQVIVVPPGAQVIPLTPTSSASSISPSIVPLTVINPSSPAIRVPVVTQVPALQGASRITKFIPISKVGSMPSVPQPVNNAIPVKKVSLGSQVPLLRTVPIMTKVNPVNSVVKMAPVSGITKMTPVSGVTKGISVSGITKVTPVSGVTKVSPILGTPKVSVNTVGAKVSPISSVSKVNSNSTVTKVIQSSVVGKVSPISKVGNTVPAGKIILPPPLNAATDIKSPLSSPLIPVKEKYLKDQLLWDLQRCPLPSGWAYTLTNDNNILFTQYCTCRKFPIFLRLEDNLTSMISVGHQPAKFIPYELELECFANVITSLRKMEILKWCIGIGFNNNNHSDLCSILAGRMNARCKACAKIRKNEQKMENLDILRRQRKKSSTNLKLLVRKLKRINERLETKVCKMKLIVNHLKNKQCADCLHDKFMKKTLALTNPETNAPPTSE